MRVEGIWGKRFSGFSGVVVALSSAGERRRHLIRFHRAEKKSSCILLNLLRAEDRVRKIGEGGWCSIINHRSSGEEPGLSLASQELPLSSAAT